MIKNAVRFCILFLLTHACNPVSSAQTTWYVPDNFPAGIQAAISDPLVVDGDTIIVRRGTYHENLDFSGKTITLRSEQGPASTTIDGGVAAIVVRIATNEGTDTVLDGFTISGASYHNYTGILCLTTSPSLINNWITIRFGTGIVLYDSSAFVNQNLIRGNTYSFGVGQGGILCRGSLSEAVISNNTITKNGTGLGEKGGIICVDSGSPLIIGNTITFNRGHGIYSWDAEPVICDNIITNNYVNGTGSISCSQSNVVIENNWIAENIGSGIGAGESTLILTNNTVIKNERGISSYDSHVILKNNIVAMNYTDGSGGGISCSYSDLILTNNTIASNRAMMNGGGLCAGYGCTIKIRNSILWNNAAATGPEIAVTGGSSSLLVNYSDVKGGIAATSVHHSSTLDWGDDMLDDDPLFVDPANGDFHLTFPSPCKDGGNNSAPHLPGEDFEMDPRIAYGKVDLGADEFHPHLYYTGNATPAGLVDMKIIGLPGAQIDALIGSMEVIDPPLISDYGLWHIGSPMFIVTDLGSVPRDGFFSIIKTIPKRPVSPYNVYIQAALDSQLTNLCVLEIR